MRIINYPDPEPCSTDIQIEGSMESDPRELAISRSRALRKLKNELMENFNNPTELPTLDELFSPGYSAMIIEGTYNRRKYSGKYGEKLLKTLNETTELITKVIGSIERGRSYEYGYSTRNEKYIFKHNSLFLEVHIFEPRSKKNLQYSLIAKRNLGEK